MPAEIDAFARRPKPAIWICAAILAVALHAAALASALMKPTPEDGDDLGAPGIEVGIELAAPMGEVSDLPPGPEADAAASSTASIQQKAVPEVQEERPEEKPVEAEDPDRVVAPERVEKKEEPAPTPVQQQSEASAESVASEAAAMPAVETAKEAPTSVSPDPGTGENAMRVKTTWQRRLVSHLDRHKRYPPGEIRRAVQTLVTFTIDRTGHVLAATVAQSSGDAVFDQAAVAMLRRSDPVPPPPALVADEGLTFTVPVVFRAKGKG